ncbi:HAD hydrolase-like protein [Streptomyces sp. 8K308]|uniref:HAD hydrolase-like protein n=1 Tax=Streptomyces sp. 8K308 TaxID=2530388 RepID=UPI001FB575B6|nr:HAD hydrolase-like protein [Streptomyces sp. 8K308]
MFQTAAALTDLPLTDDSWLIGDSPHADIAGAHALGLRSVWVSRPMPCGRSTPTAPPTAPPTPPPRSGASSARWSDQRRYRASVRRGQQ